MHSLFGLTSPSFAVHHSDPPSEFCEAAKERHTAPPVGKQTSPPCLAVIRVRARQKRPPEPRPSFKMLRLALRKFNASRPVEGSWLMGSDSSERL